MANKQIPDPSLTCQHPRDRRYYDRHTGDKICQDCGTVVGGDDIKSGPYRNDTWKKDQKKRNEKKEEDNEKGKEDKGA
jgi:hypothetical protein